MVKFHIKTIARWAIFIAILLIALKCRDLNENRTTFVFTMLGAIQTVLYIGLVVFWGVSIKRRIVHKQTRILLQSISFLLIIWFLQRGIKYYVLGLFQNVENIKRYVWYGYYFPMLLLPIALFETSLLLRKQDSYRLPKKAFVIPGLLSAVLFLTVLTNDLHQLIFKFPENATVFTDANYSYGVLYYFCLVWMIGCVVAALVMMLRKCRVRDKKFLWLPILPMAICMCYIIAYIMGKTSFFNDLIIINSFLLIAILETAIVVGLIPSNMHYEELLRASKLPTIITDNDFVPVYYSEASVLPDSNLVRQAAENKTVTRDGMRISAYPLSNGYAFWEDDITELLTLVKNLEELQTELEDEQVVMQEAYTTKQKRQRLEEKNRLYNMMQSQTKFHIEKLKKLADCLEQATSEESINHLIGEIAVIATYLKRRNNLIFIAEETDKLSASELSYCIKESLTNLALCDISGDYRFDLSGTMHFDKMTELYDAFQRAITAALPSLSDLFVRLSENEEALFLTMDIQTATDLTALAESGFAVEQDDDREWSLEYVVSKGGDCL